MSPEFSVAPLIGEAFQVALVAREVSVMMERSELRDEILSQQFAEGIKRDSRCIV